MFDSSNRFEFPLGRAGRVLLAAWVAFLIAGFSLAAWLEPDPRGFGTHQRLGLPPCTFIVVLEMPCPSCGMTTSFSNFVRGRFFAAARANPAGLLLASTCALQIPWACVSAWRGRLWLVERPEWTLMWLMSALGGLCLLQWLLRLAF